MSVQIVVDSKLAATNRTVNTFLKKTTRFFIMTDMRGLGIKRRRLLMSQAPQVWFGQHQRTIFVTKW